MRRILAIAKKEFTQIRRDPRLVAMVLVMPLFQLLLFSYALSTDVKNIPTAVLDQDNTQISRQFITSFQSSNFFEVTQRVNSMSEVDGIFDRGKDTAVIIVKPGFGSEITGGRQGQVAVLVDGSDPNAAQRASGIAQGLSQVFTGKLITQYMQARGVSISSMGGIDRHVSVWYNPEGRSQFFMIPGLIVILIMGASIMQTAISVVREKEQGTMEQLIASPVGRLELMIGKVMPWAVLSAMDVVIIAAFGLLVFQVPFRGSAMLFSLAALLFVVGNLGMGLWISSWAPTIQTATMFSSLMSILPGMMLSGFMFPIKNMPVVVQAASYIFPARYFMTISRTIFLKGGGLDVLGTEFVYLAGYAVVMLVLAAVTFRKRV